MPAKPPLGLSVEITTASGTNFRWGKGSGDPGNIAQHIRFSTRLGDGFADGGCSLARRIDRDYVDVNLLDDVVFSGNDGSIAYEGRIGSNPRSIDDAHSLEINAAGWMTNARDKKAQVIFIDRSFGDWSGQSVARQIALTAGTAAPTSGESTVDPVSKAAALKLSATGAWVSPGLPNCEAWYNARGLPIGSLYYAWKIASSVNSADANWSWVAGLCTDDLATTSDTTAELRAAGPGTGTLTATTSTKIFARVRLSYAANAGSEGVVYALYWTCLAVYGNHGLTKQGTGDATNAPGLLVSDMIRYVIDTYCPKLNSSGVTATTYPVQHAVYLDPTDPFDVIADLNKYHRFIFGVEENKRFYYRSVDLGDYDWSVDYNEPGVTIALQGDSTDGGVYSGISVNFTDLSSGLPGRITPLTNPTTLLDTNPNNPAIEHGIDRWADISLSTPMMPADAAQIGKAALAEMNTPKGQGSITIKGHIKDRAGHWQQGWKPRAGDRVAITSSASLSDRPRLISETSWDQDSLTLTITVEDTAQRVDAFLDRLATALTAANLQ